MTVSYIYMFYGVSEIVLMFVNLKLKSMYTNKCFIYRVYYIYIYIYINHIHSLVNYLIGFKLE